MNYRKMKNMKGSGVLDTIRNGLHRAKEEKWISRGLGSLGSYLTLSGNPAWGTIAGSIGGVADYLGWGRKRKVKRVVRRRRRRGIIPKTKKY